MEKIQFDQMLMAGSIAVLVLEERGSVLHAAIAVTERFGMYGWVQELASDPSHPLSVMDKLLSSLSLCEAGIVYVYMKEGINFKEIEGYLDGFLCHYIPAYDNDDCLAEVYGIRSLLAPEEHLGIDNMPLAKEALLILANQAKSSACLPLAQPKVLHYENILELVNHPLEQLEIVSPNPKALTLSSVILKMKTPMGKRLGRFRLNFPLKDAEELERRFVLVDKLGSHRENLYQMLGEFEGLERLWFEINAQQEGSADQFQSTLRRIEDFFAYLENFRLPYDKKIASELSNWQYEFQDKHPSLKWLSSQQIWFGKLLQYIAEYDVAVTTSVIAKQYGLSRPTIVQSEKDEQFLQVMGLRHLLVELQGIDYVANDIVMGNRDYLDLPYPDTVMLDSKVHDGADIYGVLLYGINSSGKSSLMKSLGIAVILAQAGFYVPAKSMKFSLFEGVFTRVLSRDNIAKSLSTFGVEMMELNAIFTKAGPKMLVLGDEISHGTETLSAVSIVASTILELTRKKAMFLLTTHLHQLSVINELNRLREVVNLHLSVHYDADQDKLIYDRKLRAGRGSSIYGLEFAESLHMEDSFLHNARKIRDQLSKEYDVLELSHQKEYIKRYRDAVASECVICGALVRQEQVPFTQGRHHNLIPLCAQHFRSISEGKIKVERIIMTPKGLRLEYEEQL